VLLCTQDDNSAANSELPATLIVKLYYNEESYHAEVKSYERMRAIQGTYIPKFYGTATFHGHERPAIVLQYLSGIEFWQLADMEKRRWTRMVSCIYDAFDAISKYGVFHTDVSESNIFISGDPGHDKVYILDFGMVEFQDDLNECRRANKHEATRLIDLWEDFCKEARPDGTVLTKECDLDENGHRLWPTKWTVRPRREHFEEVEKSGVAMMIRAARTGASAPHDPDPRIIYKD